MQPLESRYRWLYARLVPVAREHGYALALHGSVRTDLDLLAVPWVGGAADAFTLACAIAEAAGGTMLDGGRCTDGATFDHVDGRAPAFKPHGRMAWTIHLGGGPYIDLSVMPRR